MKLGKQILAFLLSAFVAVPLLGCGDGSAQLIERMSERMQNVQSARMGMTMDLGLSAGGQSTALSMDMQIDYMQEPLAMKIEMGLSGISTEDASDRLTMYLQQTDSLLHTYMRQGQQDWQHIALPQGQLTEQMQQALDTPDMMTALFDANQFRKVGTEQMDGINTVKVSGKLGAEAVTKLLLSSGLSENIGDLDEANIEQLRSLIDQMGEISITYWIDEQKAELRKAEVDMTQTLNGVLQKLSTQTGGEESLMMLMNLVQFDVCKLTVTYADIDAVSSIEIPQEALDAPVQDTQDPSAI